MAQESSRGLEGYSDTVNISPKIDVRGPFLQWLSPLEPRRRHQELQSSRIDGVGSRFLETAEFRKWSGGGDRSDPAVLFYGGDLGTGKSYLK